MYAQLVYHLPNSCDIIVATTYKADQCLPCVLFQYANSGELRCSLFKVRISSRPLGVKLCEVDIEVEVVANECLCIVVCVFRVRRVGSGRRWTRQCMGGGRRSRRKGCFVEDVCRILSHGKYAAVECERPFSLV